MAKASLRQVAGGGSFSGNPKIEEVNTNTTPGSTDTLFSFVVGAGKVVEHHQVVVSCRVRGIWKLLSDANVRASRS